MADADGVLEFFRDGVGEDLSGVGVLLGLGELVYEFSLTCER